MFGVPDWESSGRLEPSRDEQLAVDDPPHPGEVIRTGIIEANRITGISRQAPSGLLNSNVDLTGDMMLRIETAFGPKMERC